MSKTRKARSILQPSRVNIPLSPYLIPYLNSGRPRPAPITPLCAHTGRLRTLEDKCFMEEK